VRDPLEDLFSGSDQPREYRARDLVRAVELAAEDDHIKTVVLDLSQFSGGGLVTMQELGAAIDKVRAAKKPVLAYAMVYSDDALLLASHASEVWVHPLARGLCDGTGRGPAVLWRVVPAVQGQPARL
jgi:protease-4